MKRKSNSLPQVLLLALLLCLLAALMFAPHASGSESGATQRAMADSPHNPVADQQACYTIDTARPEWVSWWSVYLPLVLKDYTP